MVNRLGKVDEGSSVTDYDEEEIQRKFSITSALAYAEWGKTKINLIDTPGYNIFMHETEAALLAAESALVLVHAVAGVEVQTEKVWGFCEKYALPRVVVINQLDRDRASFERALSAIREAYGRTVVPVQLPLGEEKHFRGVIDLVRMKALLYDANGSGKAKESDIPPELSDAAAKAREGLIEMVAEAFAGRVTYFKVMSGVVKNEANLTNFNRGGVERLSHIAVIQGKTSSPVAELRAGDIGAVAKLRDTLTGDTLGDKSAPIFFPKLKLAEPAISFAIEPKSRGDEDKLSTAIHRMLEEDLLLRFSRDAQTKEFLLSGAGQQHVEVAVSKLKRRFNVQGTLKEPKIPYRETVRAQADAQGRVKRQTRGHRPYC